MSEDRAELRVLFHTHDGSFQTPGGADVQLLKTRGALQDLGVVVDLFDRWQMRLADYPLLHSFSVTSFRFWPLVKAAGCVLAVSPVLWPAGLGRLTRRAMGAALAAGERMRLLTPGAHRPQFDLVDVFFPNSQMEADRLCSIYAIPPERMHVVPNGVDERFAAATPDAFVHQYGLQGFVLCVGAFEVRKNQLALIRALGNAETPVVFIGGPRAGSEGYYEQCRGEASADMHFLGNMDHESPLLSSAYAAAGVLVMPSRLETPGLVALEAGLAGTSVVVTTGGCTREYFGDDALYVNPDSEAEIRVVTLKALESRPDTTRLRERIRSRFLWRHAAEATLAGYRKVLAGRDRL